MSRVFELVDNGKIPVKNYGYFDIVASILEFDYPKCFIARNQDQYYAFLEIEKDDNLFGWDVTLVSLRDINYVNSGKKDVQSLFKDKQMYLLLFKDGAEFGILENVESFGGKYSIQGSLFVPDFCDMDVDFDYHRFALLSKEEKSSKVSIVLQDNNSCSTGLVIKIINYLKSMCGNLANPLPIEKSKFSVQDNSTVITFSFDENCGPLFKPENIQSTITEGVNELGNFLASNDALGLLTNQDKKNNTAIRKYEKLVESFSKTKDSQPKIVISTPTKEMPISYKMDKNSARVKKHIAKKALEIAKSNIRKETTIVERNGILTGIITGKGNFFRFESTFNEVFTGIVDFGMIGVEQFDVKGTKYHAKIEKTSLLNKKDDIIDNSCKLVSLQKLEDGENLIQSTIDGF